VNFVYVWENPSDHHALVNIETYIVLKGFCEATVEIQGNPLYATSDCMVEAATDYSVTSKNPEKSKPYIYTVMRSGRSLQVKRKLRIFSMVMTSNIACS
jgi:hypothetical protein